MYLIISGDSSTLPYYTLPYIMLNIESTLIQRHLVCLKGSYIHRRRKRGARAARPPPNNLRGGWGWGNIPFGPPPNNPPTCTGKTIPLNSILEFSIISYFKMRNVIIWHWFAKNLVGTWSRNDVDATALRRIDVIMTSCACWEFAPPLPRPPPIFLTLPPPPPNILDLPTPMTYISSSRQI